MESELGQGSTFHFTLPFGFQAQVTPQDQKKHAGFEAEEETVKLRHFKILLAEDNRVNQKVACRFLEKRGHTVFLAESGKQALERPGGNNPSTSS